MSRVARFLPLGAAALALAVTALATSGTAIANDPGPPVIADGSVVEVQILALNDFHGNLLPPSGSSGQVGGVDAGGAEFLATHVDRLEQTNRNSIVVSAGDLIGASPLLSALFHDEPTIEAMNEIGLDLNAVGNHEFDEGRDELVRMQRGGCHLADGCQDGTEFGGDDFQFLAANVVDTATGRPLFKPYVMREFNGANVAFIGMTLEGTPLIVSASGIQGLEFRDEADTVNALIPELKRKGADAIVVLVHEGGVPATFDINGCSGVSGPIVDIVNRLDQEVDLVISGHTHQPYHCVIDGIPTTSAFSFGRLVTDIDMRVDRQAGEVQSLAINNRIVTRDVPADPDITALIDHYEEAAGPIANRPIGRITADILNPPFDQRPPSQEFPMGDVIADAQLAATSGPDVGAAAVAFMNPGGVRASLTFPSGPAGEGDGVVTYGEAFTVQPFGNTLQTLTLTGAQLDQLLEQQFCGVNSPANNGFFRVLLPSAGFSYTWDGAQAGAATCPTDPALGAVDPATVTIAGAPLDLGANYRVTVNSFLADGGDGFSMLRDGTERLGGVVDLDAFEAYLTAAGDTGISPPPLNRITRDN